MLISQAPLPWWGWLLGGMGGGIAALTASKIVDITEDGAWAMAWWLVGIMAGLGGCISFVIGLVRFAKWVWVR